MVDVAVHDPLVGQLLDGRYLVRSHLARGGMATVYLALDRRLDRDVALKVMHPHLARDEEFTARFIREARSAARLSHPNVVQMFDQGDDGPLVFLAMEYLRGRTLREVLHERGVLTPGEALIVLEPVLDALSAAHRVGIVHRDVKPENVMLTDDGQVKVADFGLARAAGVATSTSSTLLGTIGYLSPELVSRGIADARSDVYAAGILLFEMLTGQLPYQGEMPIQIAYQHVHHDVPAPSCLVPELSPDLDHLVQAATARDPELRPADAGQFLIMARLVREGLSDDELDRRPDSPVLPSAAHRGSSDARAVLTEIVDRAGQQRTQAMPGVAALQAQLGARHEPQPPDDDPEAELIAFLRRRRRRGVFWLLALVLLAVVLGFAGWWYAAGPGAFTTTPALTGETAPQAERELRQAGLIGTEELVYSAATTGSVVDTVPPAGGRVRTGGQVTLRISKGPQSVNVPQLAGLKPAAAVAALTEQGLGASATSTFSDVPAGQVIDSSPAAGQPVKVGATVAFRVSKGPRPVAVPDVVGETKAAALATLSARRLGVRFGAPAFDTGVRPVPAGSVLRQTPRGATLLPNESVTLVLSLGPPLVSVPHVVGEQFDAAASRLRGLGFVVEERAFLGGLFGTVRIQSLAAGLAVPRGSKITLTVV